MTPPTSPRALDVLADLSLDVDGSRATVVADGARITVHADDPVRLWNQLAGAPLPVGAARIDGPRAIGRVADSLASVGLSAVISGPAGPLVSLGSDGRSIRGRLLTGSSHVDLGSWAALRPLVAGEVAARARHGVRGLIATALSGAAIVVVWRVARRKRSVR